MTSSRPRRRDGEATRERLLSAAMRLYGSEGFLRTTTPMLAEQAGVAEGTIYRHFQGKEHLLNEAYRQAHRWGLTIMAALETERGRPARERLRHLARELVTVAGSDPAIVRMLLSTAHEAFLDERSRTARRQFQEALVQVVAMGKSDGQVRPGPADLWVQVWITIVGFVAERVAAGEWSAEGSPAAMTLEAAWDAIAAGSGGSIHGAAPSAEHGHLPRVP